MEFSIVMNYFYILKLIFSDPIVYSSLYIIIVISLSYIFWNLFFVFKEYFIPNVREYLTMGEHQLKGKTPTAAGIAFFIPLILNIYFFRYNMSIFLSSIVGILMGILGLYDDLYKIWYKKGIIEKEKFKWQLLIAGLISIIWYFCTSIHGVLCGTFIIPLSILYILWTMFIIIGTANGVNITDGLDGLAASQSILCFLFLFFLSPVLDLNFSVEIFFSILGMIIALYIFLYYNQYPAKVFMGDSGSLMLGGYISMMFITNHVEIFLPVAGVIFVIETASVLIQYFYYKKYKTRYFLCAPIHHHFEKLGHNEQHIVFYAVVITGSIMAINYFFFFISML
jgi:phospho-N-acetylmuramoyl-pentapeptide-transferase